MQIGLAFFALFNGVFSICMPLMLFKKTGTCLPLFACLTYVIMGIISVFCGLFALRAKKWAYLLLSNLFLVQSIQYLSNSFHFTLVGPLSFYIGLKNPTGVVNINILALIIWVAALQAAQNLTRPRTPAGRP
jgi:hypothetical protein